jgi:hypothetical protein
MKKDITSPQKIARKARKIFNKEMRNDAHRMAQTFGNMVKPKPKWCPWWLWMWMIKFFIKVK